MKIKILPLIICLLCILFNFLPSFGQTTSWKGTSSVTWGNVNNWTAGLPTASIDAIIGDASFTGANQPTISAPAAAKSITFGSSKASTLTVNFPLMVSGDITINSIGILINGNATISLSGNWNNAGSYTTNSANSAVTFNGSTQSIGGAATTTFRTLNITSGGTVTLTSNIILNSSASGAGVGVINVNSGTFDLANFTADRGTAFAGGTLKIFDPGFLKIGGTNSFPANYAVNTLNIPSTVEYNGAAQLISPKSYGNLILSSSGGAVTKTMPTSDFEIYGSFTSNIGSGTSVSYTAVSNISIHKSMNIGPSTTFGGATFSHIVGAAWNNNGTFISGTSTITLIGSGTQITGNPVQNFYNLTVSGSIDLLNSGTIQVQNLVVSATHSLISNNATLQIAGTITSSANFIASAGIIEMNGTAVQHIPANVFLGNSLDQLVISNSSPGGVILDGAVDIYGSLTYSDAGLILTTNDSLTLKSTESNTAWIGDMTGKTIIGKVTVERFIADHKAWRFLSIPTNTTQMVKNAWQEGATNKDSDLVKGYGTQITGSAGTAAGFDLYSAAPSMKKYNSADSTWIGISNTTTDSIKAIDGYMVFIRGDRTANAYASTSTPTVLRTKGNLFTGNLDTIFVSADRFGSIGNPYASQLDMRFIDKTGIKDFFYLWDPQLGGTMGLGGYQVFSYDGSDYVITPGGGSYTDSGAVSNYIQSGLAFLVQADSAGGYVNFKETAKTTGGSQVARSARVPRTQLRTGLYGINADNSTYMIDGVLTNYDNRYSNSIDGMDAIKSINVSENLSIKRSNTLLVIERRHSMAGNDTIFLNLTNTKIQQYRFQFTADQMDHQARTGFVEDAYLHTSTPLNLNGSTFMSFNITNIAGSYAANRFRIVFTPVVVLPVSFTSVKAYQKNKDIAVEWKAENEVNITQYEVEKSNNGAQFTSLSVLAATGNNGRSASYQVTDGYPVEGYNFYRVKSADINGRVTYSNIVKVWMGNGKQQITIYPNPVIDGVISIQLNNMPEGTYAITLLNNQGQKVIEKAIQHAEGSSTELITIDKSMPHGIYQLQVIKPGNEIITNKLIY